MCLCQHWERMRRVLQKERNLGVAGGWHAVVTFQYSCHNGERKRQTPQKERKLGEAELWHAILSFYGPARTMVGGGEYKRQTLKRKQTLGEAVRCNQHEFVLTY
eukprot:1161155-Pelagomonas_calceolata.AAC.4